MIEIRVGSIAQRVQSRAVDIDNVDRGLPIGHDRIVLQSAEEDEHVAGFRPGRLEILMAARERFALRLAIRLAWGAGVLWIAAALFTAVIPMMDETDTAATITADRFRTYNTGSTELAGRDLYISEGCSECHTQSVRPVVTDVGLGPVSVAGDYAHENPALIIGTRIGPDLMHVASRGESFDPGLVAGRLADPRAAVDWSIMPSYSYLSDADIKAIAAYIETLR